MSLDPATTQINKYSDLNCSYTQRKTGRTVTHLTFEFAPKVVENQPKPARKAPKTATKPSDEATGRTKALRDYARTKAMLDAMNGTH